jgi:GT2 family glycosyltransferase/SAM-dependent methyltransferase
MMGTLAVSVIVPTIGRGTLLEECLRSLLSCRPTAAEIVVVDQSGTDVVAKVVDALAAPTLRRVVCDGRGIALAMNRGLEEVTNDTVFVTHDDCTVAEDWFAVGAALAASAPGAIFTGRVLPPDGSGYVPSTKSDPEPHDYTGQLMSGVLYPANMVASRDALRAIGGFDERASFRLAAEDNDLCYRWIVSGREFRYEPALVVWHHDWRTPEQLLKTHVVYARAQGAFYAKHVYARDFRILRLLAWDLRHSLRTTVRGVVRREPRWEDAYREMGRWLPVGFVAGLRESRGLARGSGTRRYVDRPTKGPQMAATLRKVARRVTGTTGGWGRRLGLLRYQPERRSSEEWSSQYRHGALEFYGQLDELARYSIILGYLRWWAAGPPERELTVLDVGCGPGLLRERLEGVAFRAYTGIDLSDVAIEEARARAFPRSTFVVGDVSTTEVGQFDVVVLNEVLYYASDPSAQLERIKALLNPGGVAVISMWRHPGDRSIWKTVEGAFEIVDRVEVRNPANAMNARGWIVACCRARFGVNRA